MKIIFDYNRTIFDPETDDLYPGVLDLLQKLSAKYELFLISRNEPARKERIEKLGVKNCFSKIMFVDKKSQQLFKRISGDAKDIIVVGDSPGDEIKIGNQLGFITIRLKMRKFAAQMPENNDELAKFEVTDIGELENIISSYEK